MFIWGGLTLDEAALEKVEAYPGLKDVTLEDEACTAISRYRWRVGAYLLIAI